MAARRTPGSSAGERDQDIVQPPAHAPIASARANFVVVDPPEDAPAFRAFAGNSRRDGFTTMTARTLGGFFHVGRA
jgi:hypothetical protein